MSRYIDEVKHFLTQCNPLPVEPGMIATRYVQAGQLFSRAVKENERNKAIPAEVIQLTEVLGQLEALNRHSTRREKREVDKRRRFTRSETFTIEALEASIKALKERLKSVSKGGPTANRIEQLIALNRTELTNMIEDRVSARDRGQRRAEFVMQHARLRARLRLAKDDATREILTQELDEVTAEIRRIDNTK